MRHPPRESQYSITARPDVPESSITGKPIHQRAWVTNIPATGNKNGLCFNGNFSAKSFKNRCSQMFHEERVKCDSFWCIPAPAREHGDLEWLSTVGNSWVGKTLKAIIDHKSNTPATNQRCSLSLINSKIFLRFSSSNLHQHEPSCTNVRW